MVHTQKILSIKAGILGEVIIGLSFSLRDGSVMSYGLMPKNQSPGVIEEEEKEDTIIYEDRPPEPKEEEEKFPEEGRVENVDFPIYDKIVEILFYGNGNDIGGIGFQILA